jgi:hypothetical protein
MKRKIQKNKIQKSKSVRSTVVPPTQEFLPHGRNQEAEASTVLCKDCRYASPLESLITVDALHVQCPVCLYVFFMDEAQRKALSGADPAPVGAAATRLRR